MYLALNAWTGRRVALKSLQTDDGVMRERLMREARSMGRLSHPNVVGVLDVTEHEGSVLMVMEYLIGANLRSHACGRALHPAAALDLLMPALNGVAAAHQAGILHRDLKPENIFVCRDTDGTAYDSKVLDFGLAKDLRDDEECRLTHDGVLVRNAGLHGARAVRERVARRADRHLLSGRDHLRARHRPPSLPEQCPQAAGDRDPGRRAAFPALVSARPAAEPRRHHHAGGGQDA